MFVVAPQTCSIYYKKVLRKGKKAQRGLIVQKGKTSTQVMKNTSHIEYEKGSTLIPGIVNLLHHKEKDQGGD